MPIRRGLVQEAAAPKSVNSHTVRELLHCFSFRSNFSSWDHAGFVIS